jgi:hypothetical protein
MRARFSFLLVPLLAAACFNTEVPPDARITCERDDDCPPVHLCSPNRFCLPLSARDVDNPALDGEASLLPTIGAVGTTFVVELTASEPLGDDPRVEGDSSRGPLTFEIDEAGTERDSLRYRLAYTAAAGDAQETVTVTARLRDVFGNESSIVVGAMTLDFEAPLVTAVPAPRPSFARDQTRVELELSVSESLAIAPVAALRRTTQSGPVGDAVPLELVEAGGAAFRYELLVTTALAEGDWLLELSGADAAGNALVVPEERGAVVVDFTPPALVDGAALSPSHARAGQLVVVDIPLSEPIEPGATLTGAREGGAETVTFLSVQSIEGTLRFTHTVGPSDVDGRYTLALDPLEDRAGNVSDAIVLPTALVLDSASPEVDVALLTSPLASAQLGHDRVEVRVTPNEPPATLGASFGEREMACTEDGAVESAWLCVTDVVGSDPGGPVVILAEVVDATGNAGTGTATVLVDLAPPLVVDASASVQITPPAGALLPGATALTVGGSARVSFTLDEPPASTPIVRALPSAGGAPLALDVVVAGATVVGTLSLSSSAVPQGGYTVEADVIDAVANAATRAIALPGPGLVVDTIAPSSPATDVAGAIVYERAPWGDNVGGPAPRALVRGAAGAVEGAGSVFVLSEDGSVVLATGDAAPDGSFDAIGVDGIDVALVSVLFVDGASNASAPAAVHDVAWTASLIGRRVGSNFPNPNQLELTSRHGPSWRGAATEIDEVGDDDGVALCDGAAASVTVSGRWVPVTVPTIDTTPPAALAGAMDETSGMLVAFGARAFDEPAEVWELDGDRWRAGRVLDPEGDGEPSARIGTSVVYDGNLGGVLLFGGYDISGPRGDTWLYDGRSWRLLADEDPTGDEAPIPRQDMAVSWDPERRRVVLFGGRAGNPALDDTWVWDGLEWTRLDVIGPSQRSGAAIAADPVDGGLLLSGGRDRGEYYVDTWRFVDDSWTLLADPGGFGPSDRARMVYSPDAGGILRFGGRTEIETTICPPQEICGPLLQEVALGAFALWDGVAWVDPGAQQGTDGEPGARWGHVMAYHPGAGLVVHGGDRSNGPVLDGTWTVRDDEWDLVVVAPVAPQSVVTPTAQTDHALSWDGERERLVLVPRAASRTWLLDDGRWSLAEANAASTITSSAPFVQTAADPVEGYLLVLDRSAGTTQTWIREGGTWSAPAGALTPDILSPSLTWDGAREEVVMWADDRTWTWSAVDEEWRDVTPADPASRPLPRGCPGLSYDAAREVVVFFGGDDAYLNDTWEWDGVLWSQVVTSNTPAPRGCQPLVYDEARQRVLQIAGRRQLAADPDFVEVYEFDGVDWTKRSSTSGELPTRQTSVAWHPELRRVVLFGGQYSSLDSYDETWSWDGGGDQRPAAILTLRVGTAELPADATIAGLDVRAVAGGRGTAGGAITAGVDVSLWSHGAWRSIGTDASAAVDAPASITASTTDPALLDGALTRRQGDVIIALSPEHAAGAAGDLAVDCVEATVRFSVP